MENKTDGNLALTRHGCGCRDFKFPRPSCGVPKQKRKFHVIYGFNVSGSCRSMKLPAKHCSNPASMMRCKSREREKRECVCERETRLSARLQRASKFSSCVLSTSSRLLTTAPHRRVGPALSPAAKTRSVLYRQQANHKPYFGLGVQHGPDSDLSPATLMQIPQPSAASQHPPRPYGRQPRRRVCL